MKDCIIIGAGPAGLSAALYLARYGRDVIVASENVGGQASTAGEIENYPGILKTSGHEFGELLKKQIDQYKNIEMLLPSQISSVQKNKDHFVIRAGDTEYESKTVLIAAGKEPRRLKVPGEDRLVGRGVSYCATCDGTFAKDKIVAVIGGGNSAADSALMLSKIAKKVTVISLKEKLEAEQIRIDRIEGVSNIEVVTEAETSLFTEKDGKLSNLVYKNANSSEEKELLCDMVFIEIGYTPRSEIFKDLVDLNEKGEIIIDKTNQTSHAGIYAAGDITDVVWKQIIIACGDGAKAAMSVNQCLEK
ncbi:MAG: FAD-dependent oxidoreductase [bacterium]